MVAVTFIFYWLYNSVKQHSSKLLTISLLLILAGAIGNIIDSVFTDIYLLIAITMSLSSAQEMDTNLFSWPCSRYASVSNVYMGVA